MGTNSIRTNLSKEDIISEIKLSLGEDFKREKTYLLVEGQDDWKFLKGIVDSKVIIFESFSGKQGIQEIIEAHFKQIPNVIGIRDRDYLTKELDKNIFFYDYSCMEMMFIKNDVVFESIFQEYCSEQIMPLIIREKLLNELRFIGLLRKYNEVNNWNIRFKGLSIAKAYDNINKAIDINNIIEQINGCNNNFLNANIDKLVEILEEAKKISGLEEVLLITQGHDFSALFAAYCKKESGPAIGAAQIEQSLRCSFRESDFRKTDLYNALLDYQGEYRLSIVS